MKILISAAALCSTTTCEAASAPKTWHFKGNTKSEGAGGSEGSPIMRRVYSLSTSTGKVMESGKTADWSTAAERAERQTQTDGRTDRRSRHTKRLEPCSSIWPGQIRLTAFRDLSGAAVQVHYLDGWERSQPFTDSVQYTCLSVCVCESQFLTLVCPLCPETHRKERGSSCQSPADLSGYFWSLADK